MGVQLITLKTWWCSISTHRLSWFQRAPGTPNPTSLLLDWWSLPVPHTLLVHGLSWPLPLQIAPCRSAFVCSVFEAVMSSALCPPEVRHCPSFLHARRSLCWWAQMGTTRQAQRNDPRNQGVNAKERVPWRCPESYFQAHDSSISCTQVATSHFMLQWDFGLTSSDLHNLGKFLSQYQHIN